MENKIFFSVIITCKENSLYLLNCLNFLNKQKFKNFEVILVSENYFSINRKYIFNLKKVHDKSRFPGVKRHIAVNHSLGKYIVFLDDDAYPSRDWLNEYHKIIKIKKNVILGGPAIDILNANNISQRSFAFLYKVKFFGGFPERYFPLKEKIVDDWPTVNLCVKKSLYYQTSGLNYIHWPGEDTLFCNEIFYKLKKKILYTPKPVVFHFRRVSIFKHIKQLYSYGKMRGLFFVNKINNSFKIKYTIPTLFTLYNILLIINYLLLGNKSLIFFIPLLVYIILNIFLTVHTLLKINEKKKLIILFIISNFINHNVYGIGFLAGIFSKKKIT